MSDPSQNASFLATLIQAVGIVLVAGLLLPMTRAIPGRFLRYWSLGWVCLAVGLFSLFASARYPEYRVAFLIGYCLTEYLFGFLLWAGCWDYATGERLRAGHLLALGPPAVFGVTAPVLLRDALHLFPFHSLVLGAMFLTALLATRKAPIRPHTPTTGLWLVRGSLAALALLNWHYAAVGGYLVYFRPGVLAALSGIRIALRRAAPDRAGVRHGGAGGRPDAGGAGDAQPPARGGHRGTRPGRPHRRPDGAARTAGRSTSYCTAPGRRPTAAWR